MDPDVIRLKEIKPELMRYIKEALELLGSSAIPDERAVHDIRVLLKKARAVLKLIGPHLEYDYIERDITSLKDAAKIMSSWRETAVHRKTLRDLKKEYPALFTKLAENEKIAGMVKKPSEATEQGQEMVPEIERIRMLISKTGYRLRFQNMEKLDPTQLLKELDMTYSKVAGLYIDTRSAPKARKLHEFRKRSKDFLYQLYFFRPLNGKVIRNIEKKLNCMTGDLGKINDLSQLLANIDYKNQDITYKAAMDELMIHIREKQDDYLAEVWPVAFRIFCPGKNLVNVLGYKILVI